MSIILSRKYYQKGSYYGITGSESTEWSPGHNYIAKGIAVQTSKAAASSLNGSLCSQLNIIIAVWSGRHQHFK